MNELSGILLINKSEKKPSFSLVNILRKLLKIKKIGFAGTLDPFAKGLMIMLIGKDYTKRSQDLTNFNKTYTCSLHLGYSTKTFDTESKKEFISDKKPENEEVENILKEFQGNILQTPPMFSAKKVNGQRLYKLARQNIEIKREKIQVRIKTTLLKYRYPFLDLEIECSKGTYIRSIANDIGNKLNTGAYLTSLTRIKTGPFDLKDAILQEDLEKINLKDFLIKDFKL
jgi:tRNA pseudouridine55 synthase